MGIPSSNYSFSNIGVMFAKEARTEMNTSKDGAG
jgi:hypothetical protein